MDHFSLHVFLLASRIVFKFTMHDINWVHIHGSVTISLLLFMYIGYMMFHHVNERRELSSALIYFRYYGDADRKEFSRTFTTLYWDCIGLQNTKTVKIIELAQFCFLNYGINPIKNQKKVFLDRHEDNY